MDFETFAININEELPQTITLRLAGEFDVACEPELQEALDGLGRGSDRSLVVDLSEAQFMGVGSLRRIVLAGRGFASTEFRSPAPIVEKVLRLLGFIGGTVEIEGGAPHMVALSSVEEFASAGCGNELRLSPPENDWAPASRVSRQRLGARGALQHRIVGPGSSSFAQAAGREANSSPRSLEQR